MANKSTKTFKKTSIVHHIHHSANKKVKTANFASQTPKKIGKASYYHKWSQTKPVATNNSLTNLIELKRRVEITIENIENSLILEDEPEKTKNYIKDLAFELIELDETTKNNPKMLEAGLTNKAKIKLVLQKFSIEYQNKHGFTWIGAIRIDLEKDARIGECHQLLLSAIRKFVAAV